eukprot:COSAG02_NODE_4809_length_4953_cov_118.497031_3_plen_225_part_00
MRSCPLLRGALLLYCTALQRAQPGILTACGAGAAGGCGAGLRRVKKPASRLVCRRLLTNQTSDDLQLSLFFFCNGLNEWENSEFCVNCAGAPTTKPDVLTPMQCTPNGLGCQEYPMSGVWKGCVMNCASAFRHNFSLPQNDDIGIDCPLNFLDMHGARGRRRPEYCERLGSGATATEQGCVARCERNVVSYTVTLTSSLTIDWARGPRYRPATPFLVCRLENSL